MSRCNQCMMETRVLHRSNQYIMKRVVLPRSDPTLSTHSRGQGSGASQTRTHAHTHIDPNREQNTQSKALPHTLRLSSGVCRSDQVLVCVLLLLLLRLLLLLLLALLLACFAGLLLHGSKFCIALSRSKRCSAEDICVQCDAHFPIGVAREGAVVKSLRLHSHDARLDRECSSHTDTSMHTMRTCGASHAASEMPRERTAATLSPTSSAMICWRNG